MMSNHFPYANMNTTGHYFYGGTVYPSVGVNYNPYFSSYCSNANGLLPIPSSTVKGSTNKKKKNSNTNNYNKKIIPNDSNKQSSSTPSNNEKKPTDLNNDNNNSTTIEEKPKALSILNPSADEFSLPKDNNTIEDKNNEENLSYKCLFNKLIEQSLQSIEAISKVSK